MLLNVVSWHSLGSTGENNETLRIAGVADEIGTGYFLNISCTLYYGSQLMLQEFIYIALT
jgi:hypothetical protein